MAKIFLHCKVCGKRLIERLPNGGFRFMFGRRTDKEGNDLNDPPVEMVIYGNIVMKCLSGSCGSQNLFTFFPNIDNRANRKVSEPNT